MDFSSFTDFELLLYQLSKIPGYKAKKGEKNDQKASPLISPAIFKPGSTRSNANVDCWAGWAALDVDDFKCDPATTNFEAEVDARFGRYTYVCYSTASCTREKPKFRLVFPLTCDVPNEKIRHFWYALNTEMRSAGDAQTKDLSRMYYVPAQYPGAWNFIYTHVAETVDPHKLMARHEFHDRSLSFMDKLPPELKKQILDHRKSQLTNTDVRWTSYQDCPFVNKKLVAEYKRIACIDGTGRYRMIYKLMSSIACFAIKKRFPITATQIAAMIKELDADTARIYQKRPLVNEAERALEYAYKNALPMS